MQFRTLFSSVAAAFAAVTVAAALSASLSPARAQSTKLDNLHIVRAAARATVPQQQAAGAYLTLENKGKVADRLIAASTPVARSVELHSMALDGDIMRMREVDAIEVRPQSTVEMKPGEGFHLMLQGLRQPLNAGDKFQMTLQFEKAGKTEVTVTVEGAKGAKQSGGHHGH